MTGTDRFCTGCGEPVDEGARFCGRCGQPLVTGATAPLDAPTQAPRSRRRIWLAAAGILLVGGVAAVLLLLGSDGGARSVEADLDPSEGGVVELAGLSRLEVPPGALTDSATVSLVAEPSPPAGAPPGAEAAGEAVRVEVSGAELAAPVILELSYDEAAVGEESIVFAGFYDEEEGRWFSRFGEVDEESGRVIIEATHLSRWSTFTRTLSSVVDRTADRAASTLGFLKRPLEFLGVPAATIPRCPGPVGRMMISSYLLPEVQDLVLACVESGEEEHEAVVRLVNNRAFPLIVELPSGVEVEVGHTEQRRLFDAATSALRGALGLEALFLPGTAETTVHLGFPQPGEATFTATSSDLAIGLDLLVSVFLELGAAPEAAELVRGFDCLISAIEGGQQGGDLEALTETTSDCASRVVPGLGSVRNVFHGITVTGQRLFEGVQPPTADVTIRYMGPATAPPRTEVPREEWNGRAVWDWAQSPDVFGCPEGDEAIEECIADVMSAAGASPQATEFYRTTQWILGEFNEHGTVDTGFAYYGGPAWPNHRGPLLFLNGDPDIINVDDWMIEGWEDDPRYRTVMQDLRDRGEESFYTSLDFSEFESAEQLSGGQRFVVQIPVAETHYRAADPLFYVRFEGIFDDSGRLQKKSLLDPGPGLAESDDAQTNLAYVPPSPAWFDPPALPEGGGAQGSGCTPGADVLPDGAWFAFVEAKTDTGISFDLACLFWLDTDDEPDYRIDNDSSRLRRILVASDTPVMAGWCSYDDPAEILFRDWNPQRVDFPCWVWIYINGGDVTYIAEPYFS